MNTRAPIVCFIDTEWRIRNTVCGTVKSKAEISEAEELTRRRSLIIIHTRSNKPVSPIIRVVATPCMYPKQESMNHVSPICSRDIPSRYELGRELVQNPGQKSRRAGDVQVDLNFISTSVTIAEHNTFTCVCFSRSLIR